MFSRGVSPSHVNAASVNGFRDVLERFDDQTLLAVERKRTSRSDSQ